MLPDPVLDPRRAESLFQELQRYAPHYVRELNLADAQGAGPALMRIFAFLAETVLVRLRRAPHKHFVAFLASLGISLLPARPARAAVTFKLASGLNDPVVVPPGTRVTAPGDEDEIPFETLKELLAIPGVLTAAYGTDPNQDKIYAPPPGFLDQEIRAPSQLVYEVQSFAAAKTNRLQLDHATELGHGSFLLIGGADKVVVESIADGRIVTLKDPLTHDVAAQTGATPIRDFEAFGGINVQEHILYLGHADLLTVKEEAEIQVYVTLLEETGVTFTPFEVECQIRTTINANTPDAKDVWQTLDVVADSTAGLSRTGFVRLHKPANMEIKEAEAGSAKSKWLRVKLIPALPADGRPLPEIDTVRIKVTSPVDPATSKPKTFLADQGFHNATPLDLKVKPNVGFFPFGTEPRQFDQFYIASKEAFSKRGAQVDLSFQLDLQTLAAPAVVHTSSGAFAYSIGLRRAVFELTVQTGQTWRDIGALPDDAYRPVEDSVPSAIANATGTDVFVFVHANNASDPNAPVSKMWLHSHQAGQTTGNWIDLGAPPNVATFRYNPVAIRLPLGSSAFARVFVVGDDNRVHLRDIVPTGAAAGTWRSYDPPDGQRWASSPFVEIVFGGSKLVIFLTDVEGFVNRITLDPTGIDWNGATCLRLKPLGSTLKLVSTPFAQSFGSPGQEKVFAFGQNTVTKNWSLFECNTTTQNSQGEFVWESLGAPPGTPFTDDNVPANPDAHTPRGLIESPSKANPDERKHIFFRGADNRLYERDDSAWEDRTRAGDPDLRDSPAVDIDPPAAIPAATRSLRLLSASGRNSIIVWEFEVRDDTIPASPTRLGVLLDPAMASTRDDEYVGKTFNIASTPPQSPTIVSYDGERKLVRVAGQLNPLPSTGDALTVDSVAVGGVQPGGSDLVAFHLPVAVAVDARTFQLIDLLVNGNPVGFTFYSHRTGIVSLTPTPAGNFQMYLDATGAQTEYRALEDTTTVPELSWEYWDGHGWLSLPVTDGTRNLLANGDVTFTVPASMESTEVAGQNNFWIRARLVGGDYGRETFRIENNKVISEKSSLRPPKVSTLQLSYDSPPVLPESCVTFNNLDYIDQTAACQLGGAHFTPFYPLDSLTGRSRILFLGFDKPFKTGPVRLLIDAAERDIDETRPPQLEWLFRKDRQWRPLGAEDETLALTRQGLVSLLASEELTLETRFGKPLYWIAAALRTDLGVADDEYPNPLLRGVFLNTVWALQGETITGEILGSSDGEESQVVKFQHDGVLDGEEVRVRETLTAEEREQLEREGGKDAIATRDDLEGEWVRWRETAALFDAGPEDRCYVLDRAAGLLQFGDGTHGRIPPAGVDNIRAFSYRTGGGARGNVPAGKINALVSAVAGIESVFNPTPTGGGSDKATTEAMLEIGPRRISHRDRAVSVEDFEQLAQEASRQVAKVRCLATTNLERLGIGKPDPCDATQRHEAIAAPGWVSLIIVPDSQEALPCPSLELRRTVKDYLLKRVPSVLASGETIVVRPPDYVRIAVQCDIVVTSLDQAATAERTARSTLEDFLHPLHGGPDGRGWEFGRPLWRSDVLAQLERIDEVDRIEDLVFEFGGQRDRDRVVIGPNELFASGQHVLRIRKA